jgi:hypothetical protein
MGFHPFVQFILLRLSLDADEAQAGKHGAQQQHCLQQETRAHARPALIARRSRRRVRSCTRPASWPQAASMSSPRVLRVIGGQPCRDQHIAEAVDGRRGRRTPVLRLPETD